MSALSGTSILMSNLRSTRFWYPGWVLKDDTLEPLAVMQEDVPDKVGLFFRIPTSRTQGVRTTSA
jgi:hypothetical protein